MITPTRFGSRVPVFSMQESLTAWTDAPIENWANRSKRRASFFSM